jgi:hypothetical protein
MLELTYPAARKRGNTMPEPETIERAEQDKEEEKSPSTQAGEFVREEMHHVREGKHGARSPQQAIAIGFSKARRAGVKLAPPKAGRSTNRVRKQAERDLARGRSGKRNVSPRRSRATENALREKADRAFQSPRFCGRHEELREGAVVRRYTTQR